MLLSSLFSHQGLFFSWCEGHMLTPPEWVDMQKRSQARPARSQRAPSPSIKLAELVPRSVALRAGGGKGKLKEQLTGRAAGPQKSPGERTPGEGCLESACRILCTPPSRGPETACPRPAPADCAWAGETLGLHTRQGLHQESAWLMVSGQRAWWRAAQVWRHLPGVPVQSSILGDALRRDASPF